MELEKVYSIFHGVGTLFGALVIAYFTYLLTLNSQKQISDYQKRQIAYSRLQSLNFSTKQLFVSRYEARILSDYHEFLWHKAGNPKDSLDYQEAIRWMKQSEDLVFKIVENQKELYSCLADIQILFKNTGELTSLIDVIYNIKAYTIKVPEKHFTNTEVEEWKIKAVKELQFNVDKDYGENINNLAIYIKNELKNR